MGVISIDTFEVRQVFSEKHKILLQNMPVSCRVGGACLFAEPVNNSVVVFGEYKLVFCCVKQVYRSKPVYETQVFHRTLCLESDGPVGADSASAGGKWQAFFSQPLQTKFRLLSKGLHYVEVEVSGEVKARAIDLLEMPAGTSSTLAAGTPSESLVIKPGRTDISRWELAAARPEMENNAGQILRFPSVTQLPFGQLTGLAAPSPVAPPSKPGDVCT